jgi:hypothetical protein
MVLPVTFTGFTVTAIDRHVQVSWTTENELNNRYYEIERSYDLVQWTKLATMAATAGSTSGRYSYMDASMLKETVHYRIKQIDVDGRFVYTPYRSLMTGEKPGIKIWSGPSTISIQFSAPIEGPLKVQLLEMSGKVVQEGTINQPVRQAVIDKRGKQGYYVLIVTNSKDVYSAQKLNL